MGDGQHVHAKGVLQLRLLIEDISDFLDIRILFQFQDNADTLLAGLVGNVYHIRKCLVLHQFCNVHQEFVDACADHSVWDLTDDQFVAIRLSAAQFYFDFPAQLNLANTGLIDGWQIFLISNDAPRWKIRTRHQLHHLF